MLVHFAQAGQRARFIHFGIINAAARRASSRAAQLTPGHGQLAPPPLLLSSPTYNPLHPSCRQSPESAPSVRPYLAPCPINPTPAPLKMAQNRRFCRQIPLQTRSCGADRRPWRSPADPSCKFPCKIKKRADRFFPINPLHLFFYVLLIRLDVVKPILPAHGITFPPGRLPSAAPRPLRPSIPPQSASPCRFRLSQIQSEKPVPSS